MKEGVSGFGSENTPLRRKESSPLGTGRLIIMRHAEAQHNVPGQSHITSPQLTVLGRKQAILAGQYFKEQGISFSSIYTSGRPRTNQTAEFMMLPGVVIHHEERLHERDSGIYAEKLMGQTRATTEKLGHVLSQLPDEQRWDHIPQLDGVDTQTYETERAAAERFNGALINIASSHPGETILVIAHEGIMRSYLASLRQEERATHGNAESVFSGLHISNTGFYTVEGFSVEDEIKFKVTDLQLSGISDS